MSKVSFRVFRLDEMVKSIVTRTGWWGNEELTTVQTKKYSSTHHFYTDVAEFASSLGDRLLSITGSAVLILSMDQPMVM